MTNTYWLLCWFVEPTPIHQKQLHHQPRRPLHSNTAPAERGAQRAFCGATAERLEMLQRCTRPSSQSLWPFAPSLQPHPSSLFGGESEEVKN